MIITITNPRNDFSMRFLGEEEYRAAHGVRSFHEREQIAIIHRDYELYARGLSGLFSFPASQAYFAKGYRQDGSDYQYNGYENRIITFEFPQHYGMSSTQQNQVFNQKGHLLDIAIKTERDEFFIQGHLNGVSERGLIELECPSPYFRTADIVQKEELIQLNPTGKRLLPLKLPKAFFGAQQEKGIISIDALFPTDFTITLTGAFSDIKVVGMRGATTLLYNGLVKRQMVISSGDQTTYVDGVDVSAQVRGMYPTLFEGKNTLEFFIEEHKQLTDVKVRMEYQKILANIE